MVYGIFLNEGRKTWKLALEFWRARKIPKFNIMVLPMVLDSVSWVLAPDVHMFILRYAMLYYTYYYWLDHIIRYRTTIYHVIDDPYAYVVFGAHGAGSTGGWTGRWRYPRPAASMCPRTSCSTSPSIGQKDP